MPTKPAYEFDGDTWKFKALEDYIAYKELDAFVTNDAATEAHVGCYQLRAAGDIALFENQLVLLQTQMISTLRDALSHLACQTIVALCTTFEVTARDFFRSYFETNPAALFDYVGPEDARGHVSLHEILNAKSHSDLVRQLADRASGVVSKGKYGQIYSRASALCGGSEDKNLTQRLNVLQAERNKFVHERHRPNVVLENVTQAHCVVDAAIEALCQLGATKGVPGRYTCVQPTTRMVIDDASLFVKDDR
jgi:hypothetical protein